jgi:hypothetical protein
MYSTCLFCHGSLGRNEAIEQFAVGRRIAFDAKKGRLWVVCPACTRWNLTPLEERWEAIEECERRFRGTHIRISTSEVGLARLKEGLELVRIGEPLRPEFAAWRYGEQIRRRRRRMRIAGGVGIAAGAAAIPLAAPALAAGGAAASFLTLFIGGSAIAAYLNGTFFSPPWALMYDKMRNDLLAERVATQVPVGRRLLTVRYKHLRDAEFEDRGEGEIPALKIAHDAGRHSFEGDQSLLMAGKLLTRANWRGANPREVDSAVQLIDRAGDALQMLTSTALLAHRLRGKRLMAGWREIQTLNVSYVERLALEMAVHEESEHRALEGELQSLAVAWREAEEIASIADGLLLPSTLDSKLRAMRVRDQGA